MSSRLEGSNPSLSAPDTDGKMLDRRFIFENHEQVRRSVADRNMACDLDRFRLLEERRRHLTSGLQAINREIKALARRAADAQLREAARKARLRKKASEAELAAVEEEAGQIWRAIPNLVHPQTPTGPDESASREIARSGEIPAFGFPPRDHVELGEMAGLFDFAAASRVSGPGFFYLKGPAVRLERALQDYALGIIEDEGFALHATPELVKTEILAGAGYAPRGEEANAYAVADSGLHLIATSEIPLCGLHAGEILSARDLPLRLGGISQCYRPERAAGRATRGLFRVHQFSKVEMVVLCRPEDSEAEHENLLRIERRIFDGLALPYRVVDVASGDLGAPAFRKYDLEAWMPGRGSGGAFCEITSASNCTDYQARRLRLRWREAEGARPAFLHTLNGTALAAGRTMIALLENNQKADGTIELPAPLARIYGKPAISPRP